MSKREGDDLNERELIRQKLDEGIDIGENDTDDSGEDEAQLVELQEMLDTISDEVKGRLFLSAVKKLQTSILAEHEEARDDLLLSACSLDPVFVDKVRDIAAQIEAGADAGVVNVSSGDEQDDEGYDDDGDEDLVEGEEPDGAEGYYGDEVVDDEEEDDAGVDDEEDDDDDM